MNIAENKQFEDLKHFGKKNRQKYLNNTDWCVIRCLERGDIEPQDLKDKRQQARVDIDSLREATTYEEIQHLKIEF